MNRGYYKTWRKIEDSGWLKNHKLWAFWSWCLMRANYKERKVTVGLNEITLKPGDFIFGRRAAAQDLNLTESTIYRFLMCLEKSGNLSVKSNNKYSIVSIVNWAIYQQDDFKKEQQTNNKRTTNEHRQELKNKKINTIYAREGFQDFWKCYPLKINKGAAEKAWNKKDLPSLEILLAAVEKQRAWRENAGNDFRPPWKHPATWLNGKCWEDEVDHGKTSGPFG